MAVSVLTGMTPSAWAGTSSTLSKDMNNHLQHSHHEWEGPSNVVPFHKTEKSSESMMAEPVSSSSAAFGAYKLGLFSWALIGLGTLLSFCFVMALAKPKSGREVFAALFGAAVGSLFGGPLLIAVLGLQHWIAEPFGMTAIGGIFFVCGTPGWVFVRALWHWGEVSKNKTLLEIWQELRGINK